jgi:alpha-tubulin suppressor-like RCC1 family protein
MDASVDAGTQADASTSTDGAVMDAATSDAGGDAASADAGDASDNSAIATLEAPCTTALDKACTGHNGADKLVCLDGKWAHNGSCDTDARCETTRGPSQGLCVTVATGCAGKMPGASVCDGLSIKTCGPDLIDLKVTSMCGDHAHCEDGTTAACKCDTGYAGNATGGNCMDANDCADNPCGTGNTCTDAFNDYSCTCGNNAWTKDAKTCVSRFDHVSAGGDSTCAIRKDGTVACWGEGMDGNKTLPQQIGGLTNVTQLSLGVDHACALRQGGSVMCWGRNDHGQLGNSSNTDSLRTPVTVTNLNGVTQISAGDGFTCASVTSGLFDNKSAYCWGDNSAGQLGGGTTQSSSNRPVQVSGNNSNFNLVAAGSGHACGRRDNNNTISCWGKNDHGQVGTGATSDHVNNATAVAGNTLGNNVNEIVAGAGFTCARKGGSVYCWGAVPGDSAAANVLGPTQVTGLTDAAQISAGAAGSHVCARKTGNTVVCWGSDSDGQLGNGADPASATPVALSGSVTNIKEVASGTRHACVVKSNDGEMLCWGDGSAGELGNGMSNDSNVPVMVAH